ncbi:MAG: hypothetical protein GXO45_04850 [Aquificae bacterium]|nr:hypothetical protein [Aquificota bacterium]
MIVLALMLVLLSIGYPAFSKWRERVLIEGDIRKIQATLQEARMRAFTQKLFLVVDIKDRYVCYRCDGDDTRCLSLYGEGCIRTGQLSFDDYTQTSIGISNRGIFTKLTTVKYGKDNPAGIDCVVVSRLRAKLDKCW